MPCLAKTIWTPWYHMATHHKITFPHSLKMEMIIHLIKGHLAHLFKMNKYTCNHNVPWSSDHGIIVAYSTHSKYFPN